MYSELFSRYGVPKILRVGADAEKQNYVGNTLNSISMVQANRILPFAMLFKQSDAMATDRGFDFLPEKWNYYPETQISDLLKMDGNQTTWSRVTTTTSGMLSRGDDPDEGKDD